MKVIDYHIVAEDSFGSLHDQVYKRITENWQPIGGISTAMAHSDGAYGKLVVSHSQAMVKYEEGITDKETQQTIDTLCEAVSEITTSIELTGVANKTTLKALIKVGERLKKLEANT